MRIGIIGSGTAGSAAAVLFGRNAHDVTLFEAVAEPQPIGAGIVVQPTGQAILHAMGLTAITDKGAPIERLTAIRSGGSVVVDMTYRTARLRLTDGARIQGHGLGMHRGVLFQGLFSAAGATAGVTIRTGCKIVAIEPRGLQQDVRDADGNRHGPFDLVVIADGSASQLRRSLGLESGKMYRYGAMWFLAEDPERHFHSVLQQHVRGTQRMTGFLPTGQSPDGKNTVSLYYSATQSDADRIHGDGFAAWCDEVRALDPRAEHILRQIQTPRDVLFTTYRRVRAPLIYGTNGRVVLLGDAAHAMSPQLGQGANLALIDAWECANAIGDAKQPVDLAAALQRFVRLRRAHLAYYQLATWGLTPFFQSDLTWLGHLRDMVFPWMQKFDFFRQHMEESMAGIKRGLFAQPLALPAAPCAARDVEASPARASSERS